LRAQLLIDTTNPKEIQKTIEPDLENGKSLKVSTSVQDGAIEIGIETPSLSVLRGAINSYIRMIKSIEGI